MTVYVDQFPGSGWGKWNGGGHMLGTDIDELHFMASKIGLKREWFQNKRFPHYDLTANKRQLAIKNGAKTIEFGEFPEDVLVKDKNGDFIPLGES